MLYLLLYDRLRLMIKILIVRSRGDAQLRAEVLGLRHQLGKPSSCWHGDRKIATVARATGVS